MVIENYPEGFIVARSSSMQAQESPNVPIENVVEDSTESKQSNNLLNARIIEYQNKINNINDKISRLRSKISKGDSSEQDRIQYSRYVQTRESYREKLQSLKQEKRDATNVTAKAEVLSSKQPIKESPSSSTSTSQSSSFKYQSQELVNVLEQAKALDGKQPLYVEVSGAPYKEGVRPSSPILTKPSVEAKTDYVLGSEANKMFDRDYGIKRQTVMEKDIKSVPPPNVVKPTSEVFNKPTLGEQTTRLGQELITRGQIESAKGQSEFFTIAGGSVLIAKGFVENIISIPEFFSPITYKGQEQIPVISPLYRTGKSVISGEVREFATTNPLEFTGQLIGVGTSGKVSEFSLRYGSKVVEYNQFKYTDVVGGTEQFLKYGDNRINKQFVGEVGESFVLKKISEEGQVDISGNIKYGLTFNPKAILPKEPEFNEFVVQGYQKRLSDYGRNINENAFNEQFVKEGNFIDVSNRPGQLTLEGRNALEGFKEPEPYVVVDIIQSTQQEIVPIKILDINEVGEIKITEGIKLKPKSDELNFEPTTLKSTKFVSAKETSSGNVDTLFEGRSSSESIFENIDLSGRKKKSSNYNQDLILLEEPARGRVVDLKSVDSNVETIRVPIQKDIVGELNVKVETISESKYGLDIYPYLSIQKQTQVNIQQQIQTPIQKQTQVNIQQQIQTPIQKQTQVNIQQQIQTPIQELRQEIVPEIVVVTPKVPVIFTPIREPPPRVPFVPFVDFGKEKRSGGYVLEVKRKGKFERVDVGDLEQLESKLPLRLKSSLAASARITDLSGRPIGISTPLGLVRSKRDRFTIVQPRSQRLGSMAERLEIRQAKRMRVI